MAGINAGIGAALDPAVDAVRAVAPGYKTYIAAFGLFVVAAVQAFYMNDPATAFQTLLQALGLFGLRAALPR